MSTTETPPARAGRSLLVDDVAARYGIDPEEVWARVEDYHACVLVDGRREAEGLTLGADYLDDPAEFIGIVESLCHVTLEDVPGELGAFAAWRDAMVEAAESENTAV